MQLLSEGIMSETIVVGILSLIGTLIGTVAGIMTANKLTNYRIEELEKKVEKHNNLIERVALLEFDNKTQWNRIDDLEEVTDKVRAEVHI